MTPKEQNLLIRLQKNDQIRYAEFPEMLYNVRYQIASSEMMDNNMTDLELYINQAFAKYDKDDTGVIDVQDCQEALKKCKKLNLTTF